MRLAQQPGGASSGATKPPAASASSSVPSYGLRSLLFPSVKREVPTYAAAPEFSSDDFAWNDSEDFEEEQ